MSNTKRKIRKGYKPKYISIGDDTQADRQNSNSFGHRKIKSYTKKPNQVKFDKAKYNSKVGLATVTKASKLEAKNANRSLKKAVRQHVRKEIKKELE